MHNKIPIVFQILTINVGICMHRKIWKMHKYQQYLFLLSIMTVIFMFSIITLCIFKNIVNDYYFHVGFQNKPTNKFLASTNGKVGYIRLTLLLINIEISGKNMENN